ncbi:MAG: hypothetical protein HYS18_01425 [Burkholderiales bacterium]|nr:hypothetical protein [Burkholderiales bacterium]
MTFDDGSFMVVGGFFCLGLIVAGGIIVRRRKWIKIAAKIDKAWISYAGESIGVAVEYSFSAGVPNGTEDQEKVYRNWDLVPGTFAWTERGQQEKLKRIQGRDTIDVWYPEDDPNDSSLTPRSNSGNFVRGTGLILIGILALFICLKVFYFTK